MLFEAITNERINISIQAVYKSLRKLIADAIIVESGKQLEISREWLARIQQLNAFNLSSSLSANVGIPKLANGESVIFSYKNLSHLDAYWKHLMQGFEISFPDFPVFLYSPYHIWYHINERTESEASYFQSFDNHKRHGFFVIGMIRYWIEISNGNLKVIFYKSILGPNRILKKQVI